MSDYFVTGGTMAADAPSYVPRRADTHLHDTLKAGAFAYVLTPRQQGKSSLMNQVGRKLREEGVTVAALDLSALGFNLDEGQWYHGLLAQLGRRLKLDEAIEDFALDHPNLSPLQLWQGALRDVVLEKITGDVVVFLDEIDIVRSLPFSTDELFAAIRACYNARAQDPAYQRLTFCLLGVATPNDLIQNPRLTPFNIGKRIDLTDFTDDETGLLQFGLGKSEATNRRLIRRIHHWTGGHPYLTQRLCQAVAADDAALTEAEVDRTCARLFLTPDAELRDDNLGYVQQRLLTAPEMPEEAADERRAAVLTLYGQVLSGRPVADNETSELVRALKLSGIVRSENRRLVPRNRIYAKVFDRRWVREHLPHAELRRQRAAYWRGVVRTVIVVALIVMVQAASGLTAWRMYIRAETERLARRYVLYSLGITVAQSALADNNARAAFLALEEQRPSGHDDDLRKFEWRYLWNQSQQDERTIPCPDLNVFSVAVSPDGRYVAAGGQAKQGKTSVVRLWERATWRELPSLPFPGEVNSVAFSPDGQTLAAGGGVSYEPHRPGTVHVWQWKSGALVDAVSIYHGAVHRLAYAPDSQRLYFAATHRPGWFELPARTLTFAESSDPVNTLAFSPASRTLAVGFFRGIKLYDPPSPHLKQTLTHKEPPHEVQALAFSPDGRTLAVESNPWGIQLWDTATWTERRLLNHPGYCYSLAFSPDGRWLAAGCWDNQIRLWDMRTAATPRILRGHVSLVNSVAFTPDGETLISGANDGTVRVWDIAPERTPVETISVGGPVCGMALSEDGASVAFTDGTMTGRLFDTFTGKAQGTLADALRTGDQPAFPPDGRMLAYLLWKDWRQPSGNSRRKGKYLEFGKDSEAARRTFPVTMKHLVAGERIGNVSRCLSDTKGLALSANGEAIAAFGPDKGKTTHGHGALELWRLKSDQPEWVGAMRGAHSNDISTVAFSPDGKTIATGSWDRTVKLWDVRKIRGEPKPDTVLLGKLEGFGSPVYATAFTYDGKTIAVGTEDGKIFLCDIARHEILLTLKAHTKTVTNLAFSRDDAMLVSGSIDGTVRLWRAAPLSRTDAALRVEMGRRSLRR